MAPGSENVVIENNVIHGMTLPNPSNTSPASYGILVWGQDEVDFITIQNNEIYGVNLFGISIGELVSNITVSNNNIHDLVPITATPNELAGFILGLDLGLEYDP